MIHREVIDFTKTDYVARQIMLQATKEYPNFAIRVSNIYAGSSLFALDWTFPTKEEMEYFLSEIKNGQHKRGYVYEFCFFNPEED